MATGSVAIASDLLGFKLAAKALTWLNLTAYPVLLLMTLARLIRYPQVFISDLRDDNRGVGTFTVVAGTCMLGGQLALVFGERTASVGLWIAGTLLWIGLTYTILVGLAVQQAKPPFERAIGGGWLVAVVATQSVSLLGVLVIPQLAVPEQPVLCFSLCLWLAGIMLYIWMTALIFYRLMFCPLSPAELTPPDWIAMGAMAISTLAGTTLVERAGDPGFLQQLLPFLQGVTVLCWATATWWIPLLASLWFWKHVCKKVRLAYSPLSWAGVFPLGMYSICTYQLAKTTHYTFLLPVASGVLYAAWVAWAATFLGWIHNLVADSGSK
jgi:tellurite resistance protein TehA-like permease